MNTVWVLLVSVNLASAPAPITDAKAVAQYDLVPTLGECLARAAEASAEWESKGHTVTSVSCEAR